MSIVTQAVFTLIFMGLILGAACGIVYVLAPGALSLAWAFLRGKP